MADRDNRLFDSRIVERNIKKGLVTREAYNQRLADLPDMAGNAEVLSADTAASADDAPEPDAGPEQA